MNGSAMDRDDFDFPPDPAADEFDLGGDVLEGVPLRTLSNKPIEELPPTVVPTELQQRPIRQLLQGGRRQRQRRERSPPRESAASTAEEDAGSAPPAGNKRARFDWTEEELREFYTFLSQYGTDFNAIAVMYNGRSRADVKRLYHRELRRRRSDVRAALAAREAIDLGVFRARLKRREEERQGPARRLDHDEEEALRQIEEGLFGEQHEEADAEFNFDTVVDETNNKEEGEQEDEGRRREEEEEKGEENGERRKSGAPCAVSPLFPTNEYDYDEFNCEVGDDANDQYGGGGRGGGGDNDNNKDKDKDSIPLAEVETLKTTKEGIDGGHVDETFTDDLVGLNDSLDNDLYRF
ncbi:telomere-binding protein 1 [Trypanosoma theileri]|uniref:Telomere-binding protein 1 n=1 Tax=Trypanosoma theileri TaxID=67003 RepID=A0A1X0NLG0_9TRYP|nr:telomere-binding protein 1 [Trypanosoma theileri]ORC85546.1 telomere-binding protein 1 [Trypanosoma theileri]